MQANGFTSGHPASGREKPLNRLIESLVTGSTVNGVGGIGR
jgi:hypothetical protein